MINRASCVNTISKSTIEKMDFKVETHLQLYITWINKSFHSVFQRCLVPNQFSSYDDCIGSDILHMDAMHILVVDSGYLM